VAQLVKAPGEQTPCPVQAPAAHWPHPLQVSVSMPQSPHAIVRVVEGVHTGALAQEHAPHPQPAEHV
jgi:hypothetical protein